MLEAFSGALSPAGWAMLFDFDGTLVDIAEVPAAVLVPEGLPDALARLRDRLGGAMAIISGRQIAVLDRFLAPLRFDAVGNHGVERRLGGQLRAEVSRGNDGLRTIRQTLAERLPGDPGLLIEEKACSLAVHWRLAPQLEKAVIEAVEEVGGMLGPAFKLQRGKAVAEIMPAGLDKGSAIDALLDLPPYVERRPIFIGDDLTDEDGFKAVNRRGGVSVHVGDGSSCARFRLASPEEVRSRIRGWAAGRSIDPGRDFLKGDAGARIRSIWP
jgi:trehalose 6-phosphate phosphatase